MTVLVTGICLASTAATAAIYKCADANGKVIWQDVPCAGAPDTKPIAVIPANGAIAPAPRVDYKLEEKKLAERQRKRGREVDEENKANAREHQQWADKCRDLAEDAEREEVWRKNALSTFGQEHASTRIKQLNSRRFDMRCR